MQGVFLDVDSDGDLDFVHAVGRSTYEYADTRPCTTQRLCTATSSSSLCCTLGRGRTYINDGAFQFAYQASGNPWATASKSVGGSTIRGLSVRQRGSSDVFDVVEISEQGRNIYMATWDRSSGVFSAFTYVGAVRKSTPLSCIAACSHLWLCLVSASCVCVVVHIRVLCRWLSLLVCASCGVQTHWSCDGQHHSTPHLNDFDDDGDADVAIMCRASDDWIDGYYSNNIMHAINEGAAGMHMLPDTDPGPFGYTAGDYQSSLSAGDIDSGTVACAASMAGALCTSLLLLGVCNGSLLLTRCCESIRW